MEKGGKGSREGGDNVMQDLIFIGSGGCMRELLYQVENLNRECPTWNMIGYVDKEDCGYNGCPYLGDDDWLLTYHQPAAVCISVQEPGLRRRLYESYRKNPKLEFPVIRMLHTELADSTKVGEGTILCEHVKITNDGKIGECCFFNIGAQVHHEALIGDFVTVAPNVTLAGNVTLGKGSYIGMGANLIQGIRVGEGAVIGAGAAVIRDIPDHVTAVGIPARVIER